MSLSSRENGIFPMPPKKQFLFGDFILHTDGMLLYSGERYSVPPKELNVLIALLEAAGEIVSKDTLLERVWQNEEVSDDSLIRCIYALRRLLQEGKNNRYIDTIYGKGYRFARPVTYIAPEPASEEKHHSLAIFPFIIQDDDAILSNLHDTLVQYFSRYTGFGLTILPASLTQHCLNCESILSITQQLKPDYYLIGKAGLEEEIWKVRIELVRTEGHQLIQHESFELKKTLPHTLLYPKFANLLIRHIPTLNQPQNSRSGLESLDIALNYMNGSKELEHYTPRSLMRALPLFRQCIAQAPTHSLSYCRLAECYLALAQLGLFDQQHAQKKIQWAVNKAMELDATNPLALVLLALLSSLRADATTANVLIKQATLLAPASAYIRYYHAWHLAISGHITPALQVLEHCLELIPNYIAAHQLKFWLTFCDNRIDDAITLGHAQLSQYGQQHPIIQSQLALFLAIQRKREKAQELIQKVTEAGENIGLLNVHQHYISYCLDHNTKHKAQAFLASIDCCQIPSSLLPLLLAVNGTHAAQRHYQKLSTQGDPWLNIFYFDPRLAELEQSVSCVSSLPSLSSSSRQAPTSALPLAE
jgi:DNA-binding winged helix-turn-helix (wHTH) protein/Tfp pilus assembly protein PilF